MDIERIRQLSLEHAKGNWDKVAPEVPREKITRSGQPCGHCATPVALRKHKGIPAPTANRSYYYEWWFFCPACKAVWFDPQAIRMFPKPAKAPRKRKKHHTTWLMEAGKPVFKEGKWMIGSNTNWGTPTPEDQPPW